MFCLHKPYTTSTPVIYTFIFCGLRHRHLRMSGKHCCRLRSRRMNVTRCCRHLLRSRKNGKLNYRRHSWKNVIQNCFRSCAKRSFCHSKNFCMSMKMNSMKIPRNCHKMMKTCDRHCLRFPKTNGKRRMTSAILKSLKMKPNCVKRRFCLRC